VVLHLSAPDLARLDPADEAAAVDLLVELLLEVVHDRTSGPSAGPALIDADAEQQEEG
jgi:hypothetical protein